MICEGARFDALRNAIYHSSRKAFYDWWNRFLSFVIIISGAAAIADFATTVAWPGWLWSPALFPVIATFAAAIQLVFDLGGKSAKHAYLQRRYYELIADMQREGVKDEDPKWEARLMNIYADEPPPKRALDAIAYNAACEAIGAKSEKRVQIRWYQSLLRHWLPFNKSDFPYVKASG